MFRKLISIGKDGEEHYDVIDMEREAQKAVRRITDHQEIVKQYQKVDEKRKSQFKYELGRLMGEYAVPLPLGNFNLNNKDTRRLELWKN